MTEKRRLPGKATRRVAWPIDDPKTEAGSAKSQESELVVDTNEADAHAGRRPRPTLDLHVDITRALAGGAYERRTGSAEVRDQLLIADSDGSLITIEDYVANLEG